jgi:chemotaxis protein histidine kinase CheA
VQRDPSPTLKPVPVAVLATLEPATPDSRTDRARAPQAAEPRGEARGGEGSRSTVRVDASRLDRAMSQVGELVLLRNRLSAAVSRMGANDEILVRLAREMDLAVNDLQGAVMSLRMQPCRLLFHGLAAVVHEASRRLDRWGRRRDGWFAEGPRLKPEGYWLVTSKIHVFLQEIVS